MREMPNCPSSLKRPKRSLWTLHYLEPLKVYIVLLWRLHVFQWDNCMRYKLLLSTWKAGWAN